MISSSPDIVPLEHPIYDLWLLVVVMIKLLENHFNKSKISFIIRFFFKIVSYNLHCLFHKLQIVIKCVIIKLRVEY